MNVRKKSIRHRQGMYPPDEKRWREQPSDDTNNYPMDQDEMTNEEPMMINYQKMMDAINSLAMEVRDIKSKLYGNEQMNNGNDEDEYNESTAEEPKVIEPETPEKDIRERKHKQDIKNVPERPQGKDIDYTMPTNPKPRYKDFEQPVGHTPMSDQPPTGEPIGGKDAEDKAVSQVEKPSEEEPKVPVTKNKLTKEQDEHGSNDNKGDDDFDGEPASKKLGGVTTQNVGKQNLPGEDPTRPQAGADEDEPDEMTPKPSPNPYPGKHPAADFQRNRAESADKFIDRVLTNLKNEGTYTSSNNIPSNLTQRQSFVGSHGINTKNQNTVESNSEMLKEVKNKVTETIKEYLRVSNPNILRTYLNTH